MKKFTVGLLLLMSLALVFESCSSKTCPAYSSYPKSRRG